MIKFDAEIVSEHYHTFDDLPVVICVLKLSNGTLVTGVSISSTKDFDDEIATLLSLRNAKRSLQRLQQLPAHV